MDLKYQRAINLWRTGVLRLKEAGFEESFKEAELLLLKAAKVERNVLYRDDPFLDVETSRIFESFLQRRIHGEPLQYILEYVDFLDLKLFVGQGVLIPRPETELLAQEAINIIKKRRKNNFPIIDLCTGSGCIALSIAKRFPYLKVYGTDISWKALSYALKNRSFNEIQNTFFINGDLFRPLKYKTFSLIVSNPPYIKKDEIKSLERQITEWEPIEALDGGYNGLSFYKRILSEAHRYIMKGGQLLFETGYDDAEKVCNLASSQGFHSTMIMKDYAGLDRIVTIYYE